MGRLPNSVPPNLPCVGCGRMIKTTEFHPNFNKYHKYKRMYYCKECGAEITEDLFKSNASFELATRNMTALMDLPFSYDAMNILKEETEKKNGERRIDYVFNYMKALKQINVPEEYWNDLSTLSFPGLDVLKVAKPTSDGDVELMQGLEKDWGKQDNIRDYLFLEEKFNQYTNGETMSVAMINIVRYLCLAELDVQRLRNDKASKQEDITKAEKRVSDYYKQLKLDDFKFNKSKSVAEKLIEDWAYIEESQEPLDWVDERLEDICGFKEDTDHIYRSLANKIIGNKDYPKLTLDDVKNTKKKKN